MDIKKFKELPIMGIMRGIEPDFIEPLVETVISAGLKTIEITMNTKMASELIKKAVGVSKNRLMIGAGTVLTLNDLHEACDAGASFIVLPTLIEDVVGYCIKNKIPVFPGALTPQEIYNAWRAGATMVKVFPAKFFGPPYIKEIKGPFKNIELLACGGVTAENIGQFILSGASAVAFGASVFKKEWLKKSDFKSMKKSIASLISAYKSA